ncbi:DUF3223 domain-containing protein [Aminobacter sp. MET-1]|uniref:DUF3223 domain-containing protein n=1 Tax=Aminobacter sp. MET-1 TaxID=2951085 RepID=UPI00226A09B4|nr:DUF3223 domain-containing protein [Aminobacter sp. MET-1]MCX8568795.1 DCL family protein [Aminobacter sp. MET-1]
MPIPIVIGRFQFSSKAAATRYGGEVLNRGMLGSQLMGEDAEFADAVLKSRPDKLQELGDRGVVRYVRKMHQDNPTRCIFAELDDGSFLDISFWKLINHYPAG